jgi:hypothetical protein
MKRINNLTKTWLTANLPQDIKEQLVDVGSTIGTTTIWRIMEHLLRVNKKFQKFKNTEEYRKMMISGRIEDDSVMIVELKKILSNQKLIWDKLNKNP